MTMKPLAPIDSKRLKPVLESIAKLTIKDLSKHKVWSDLAKFSRKTTLSGIEAHPSGVYDTGGSKFEAVATVYLTLGDKGSSFSNSLPAHVSGTVTGNTVKIDRIKIDTTSLKS
jgi:hypothetical protein